MAARSPAVSLRPTEPADDGFLRRVYASTREDELLAVPWSDDQKDEFLRQQFDAQDAHYRAHYDGSSFDVVVVDEVPVGRLYVARWRDEIRIMEVALLPEQRNAGIGAALLLSLLDEGARTAKRVSIHVERHNPARRLYERLGFRAVADNGVHLLMEAQHVDERQPRLR
jgi:ribosomal protein S18 acetylase RimI-like enzyme